MHISSASPTRLPMRTLRKRKGVTVCQRINHVAGAVGSSTDTAGLETGTVYQRINHWAMTLERFKGSVAVNCGESVRYV